MAKCGALSLHRQNEAGRSGKLRVAWFSYFPIEWLPDLPPELQGLPKMHPATWQRVLWEELRQHDDVELDIIVLRGQFPKTHRFERGNTRFRCLRTPPGLRAATLYWWDTLAIRRELRGIDPSLVHAWGTEFAAAAIASRLPHRSLVTVQGILTWLGEHFPLNRHQRISRFLEPGSLRRARVASCESSFAVSYLSQHYPNLKILQIEHAPHPLFSRVQRAPEPGLKFVCVGPFNEGKGADVVVQALDGLLASGRDFKLLWIGGSNPGLEAKLRAATRAALWERISFRNHLSPAELARELSAATMFVHAARADNSPNSVKEAVVAGLPVIATRTGGIPDYVAPGKNGLLFESGSAEDCRTKIELALQSPMLAAGRVDDAELGRTREYLSAATMARKFMDAYRLVAALPPP